jgi:hypothetical protein
MVSGRKCTTRILLPDEMGTDYYFRYINNNISDGNNNTSPGEKQLI